MGRAPCCDKANVKKGPWSSEEDSKLKQFIDKFGTGGNWIALPHKAGLKRCGKSCRLRWLNYLRPNIKHGEFSEAEDTTICTLFATIGSRWSIIASQLPGRTDNDIKNYWNTKLKKKLLGISSSSSSQKMIKSSLLVNSQQPQNQQLLFSNIPCNFNMNNINAASPFQKPFFTTTSSPLFQLNSQNQIMKDLQTAGSATSFLVFGSGGGDQGNSTQISQNVSFNNFLLHGNGGGFQDYFSTGLHSAPPPLMEEYYCSSYGFDESNNPEFFFQDQSVLGTNF